MASQERSRERGSSLEKKKNEPHNVLLMSSSLLWETRIWAVMPQQGSFVCSSSLIWLIYSWDGDIVYPHILHQTSRRPLVSTDSATCEECQQNSHICHNTCSHLPPSRISHHHQRNDASALEYQGWGGYVDGGFMFGWMNPLCKACEQQTQPPQTALLLHRGAGPVSCCAFMQLWPFWHKCALTTGAAPS